MFVPLRREAVLMWTDAERVLFERAAFLISSGNYEAGLEKAKVLLRMLNPDTQKIKFAYVAGCQKAVALSKSGNREEAEKIFKQAHSLAVSEEAWAIAAYIRADWASLYEPDVAINMLNQALEMLNLASSTPDAHRHLNADAAYIKAKRARYQALQDRGDTQAFTYLTAFRKALGSYAYGDYPHYKNAYLVVLMWEHDTLWRCKHKISLQLTATIIWEVIRQKKLIAAIHYLRARQ